VSGRKEPGSLSWVLDLGQVLDPRPGRSSFIRFVIFLLYLLLLGKPNGDCGSQYVYWIRNKILKLFDYHVRRVHALVHLFVPNSNPPFVPQLDLHTASFGRVNSLYVRADMNHLKCFEMAKLINPQVLVSHGCICKSGSRVVLTNTHGLDYCAQHRDRWFMSWSRNAAWCSFNNDRNRRPEHFQCKDNTNEITLCVAWSFGVNLGSKQWLIELSWEWKPFSNCWTW